MAADIIIVECYRFNEYVNEKGALIPTIAEQFFKTNQVAINNK